MELFKVRSLRIAVSMSCAALLLSFAAAHAQDYGTEDEAEKEGSALSVRDRARPDYDPKGVKAGSFVLLPSLTTGIEYDDNIYALNTGEQSDVIYLLDPRLIIKSDWTRHKLNFDFAANHRDYKDRGAETYTDYQGIVGGVLDVSRDMNITSSFFAGHLHEARGSADSQNTAAEPVPYTKLESKVGVNKTFNRLQTSVGVAYLDLNYKDVDATGGGSIDQDLRDGRIVTVVNKTSYEFSPGYKGFLFSELNTRDFDGGDSGVSRDSDGYRIHAGVEVEFTRLLEGEIGVGYLSQDYSSNTLRDISGFSYMGALEWNPTGLMTVKVNGERSVVETVTTGASGRLDTTAGVAVDYEVRRNIIMTPSFNYQLSEFEGITREDKYMIGALKIDYLLNRNFSVGMNYSYTDRNSNEAGLDYERQKVSAHVKTQF